MALAAALGWNAAQFDSAIGILPETPPNPERSPLNVASEDSGLRLANKSLAALTG
jgi:hypothetical protein